MVNKSTLDSYNQFRARNNSPPLAPAIKHKLPRSIRMSDPAWNGLRALALKLGYTHYDGGNITQLLEAIGHDLWDLTPKYENEIVNNDE